MEEIEKLINIKTEILKGEFLKLIPIVRKVVNQTEECFKKMDTSKMANNIQNVINITKRNLDELRRNTDNKVELKVCTIKAQKQVDQIKQEIDALNKKINASQDLKETSDIFSKVPETIQEGVGKSFGKIIDNGILEGEMQKLLSIIENVSIAFSNLWNYDGKGEAIIQNLTNSFGSLLNAIENVAKNEEFQNFLGLCSQGIKLISEKLSETNWEPLIEALSTIGQSIGIIALGILLELVEVFKWIAENPQVAEVLISIAVAIGLIVGVIQIITKAMEVWSAVKLALASASALLNISLLPLIVIIIAIVAVIATIIYAIMHWSEVLGFLSTVWEFLKDTIYNVFMAIYQFVLEKLSAIKEFITNVCQFIKNIWDSFWNGIWNIISFIWNAIVEAVTTKIEEIKMVISFAIAIIKQIWENIWNTIKAVAEAIWNGIVTTISNVINGIKTTISNVLNIIKAIWDGIWNGLKNTVTNIFNGIWNVIKGVINSILGGIEGMANGVVNGVNTVIKMLNRLNFKVPDWVPGFGGKSFGFNLKTLNPISLPRLAKGNVAYSPLIAQFGEYTGVRHNPEITAPQSILRDTFDEVLSNHEFGGKADASGEIKQLVVQFGSAKVAFEMEKLLNQARRQNGNVAVTI